MNFWQKFFFSPNLELLNSGCSLSARVAKLYALFMVSCCIALAEISKSRFSVGKSSTKISLRKQPHFCEVATWALAKQRLSNEYKNSILMTCTTQILVVLLIGWKKMPLTAQSIRSNTKIWVVHVISMEFLHSLLTRRFVRAQVATSRSVGCFLRLYQNVQSNPRYFRLSSSSGKSS